MSRVFVKAGVLVSCAAALLTTAAAPAPAPVPDFQSGQAAWIHPPGGEFPSMGLPIPVEQEPEHRYFNAGLTFRIGDTSNPNLKPWVKEAMDKDNAEVKAGKMAFAARQSCLPAGVPNFDLFGGPPLYFIQTPKEVLIIYEGDAQVRHIYLNVPHAANLKATWYGDEIGHYEGDTLVVDTIGQTTKTLVDSYRTPHSDKLHVVERWHLIEDGNTLEVNIAVDDADAYNAPWHSAQQYRRGRQMLVETRCAENNQIVFDYAMPVAEKPDF